MAADHGFQPGSRVEVLSGAAAGRLGTVIKVVVDPLGKNRDHLTVRLDNPNRHNETALLYPADLRHAAET